MIARAILRAARLAAALHHLYPAEVTPTRAAGAAVAIVLVADDVAPAELLASIAYTESRFIPTARNRRTDCNGPMGVRGFDVRRGEIAGYVAGVKALHDAHRYCLRRRTPGLTCTLAVYRSGPRGARERLYRGPLATMARAQNIRRAMTVRPVSPRGAGS